MSFRNRDSNTFSQCNYNFSFNFTGLLIIEFNDSVAYLNSVHMSNSMKINLCKHWGHLIWRFRALNVFDANTYLFGEHKQCCIYEVAIPMTLFSHPSMGSIIIEQVMSIRWALYRWKKRVNCERLNDEAWKLWITVRSTVLYNYTRYWGIWVMLR